MNTGRVRYTRFLHISPELAPFDFYLRTKLQALTRDDNIHREPAQELEQHKYQMKCELRYDIFLPKFGLVRVLLSVEGATGDLVKVSPRGYHEGHSSRSLFQLLFLLPLVDSEAAELTVANFLRHTTISWVLSGDA